MLVEGVKLEYLKIQAETRSRNTIVHLWFPITERVSRLEVSPALTPRITQPSPLVSLMKNPVHKVIIEQDQSPVRQDEEMEGFNDRIKTKSSATVQNSESSVNGDPAGIRLQIQSKLLPKPQLHVV